MHIARVLATCFFLQKKIVYKCISIGVMVEWISHQTVDQSQGPLKSWETLERKKASRICSGGFIAVMDNVQGRGQNTPPPQE